MEEAVEAQKTPIPSPAEKEDATITPPSRNWRKIIFSVLGILLALGSFSYLGYQYAIQKQSPPVAYPTISPTPLPTTDPTANWKTYQFSRSKEYKLSEYTFSIKYPQEWTIKESSLRPDELAYKVQFFSPGKTYIDLNIGPSENIDTFENQVANAKGYFESPKEENLGIEGFSQSIKISGKVKPSANPEGISYYTERVFLQKNQKIISLILTQDLNENYTEKFNQILSTFKFLDRNSKQTLKSPDFQTPVAGVCSGPTNNQIVVVTFGADNVPSPRCGKVTSNQKLEIVNNTDHLLQGNVSSNEININPGQKQTINANFGSYLMPGVHSIFGAEIWLQ